MGKRGQRLTDEERQQIIDLLDDGLTHGQIVKKVGRHQSTVSRIARQAGADVHRCNLARVETAQETKRAVDAERRAHIAALAADRAEELLAGFHDSVEEVVPVPGVGAATVTRKVQPRDHHYRASASGGLWRQVMDVAKHDERGTDARSAVEQWLQAMTE